MVAAADLDAKSTSMKGRRHSSGLPFDVKNMVKYSLKNRLSPESPASATRISASGRATPKIFDRNLRTSMTVTIQQLEKSSPLSKHSPLGKQVLNPLNERSGQNVTGPPSPNLNTLLYSNIEKQYPTFDLGTDYRTFIFDENDKIDYDAKRKIKKEKLL